MHVMLKQASDVGICGDLYHRFLGLQNCDRAKRGNALVYAWHASSLPFITVMSQIQSRNYALGTI